MGASYNTIALRLPTQNLAVTAVTAALDSLGLPVNDIIPLESNISTTRVVIVGQPLENEWIPITSWGDGMSCTFPRWYSANPLALALSRGIDNVVYIFSYNSGQLAGYRIFGHQKAIESRTVDGPSGELSNAFRPIPSARLTVLLDEPLFDYETFMGQYQSLEVGTAQFAKRLGLFPHLLDAIDLLDGDGAIAVDKDQYTQSIPSGWVAIAY